MRTRSVVRGGTLLEKVNNVDPIIVYIFEHSLYLRTLWVG